LSTFNQFMRITSEWFTYLVYVITLYYLFISFFGLVRKKDYSKAAPSKRFAVIVAAYNEEIVIGDMMDSLNMLNYPKELYDVFVIADNCTDNTAAKARNKGVVVFERFDKDKKGKGYALEWIFNKIFEMEKKYDSVVIFDADNLVHRDFLMEMNKKLCQGFKVVQGYLDVKNPTDTWITGSYSIAFWTNNRMFQLGRSNIGLSNQLGGTGFCVDVEILKKLGWGATCLTEDLEFTCKLVLNGYKVGWAHDAIIFDEKPLALSQSWRQRKRWMQGFADVSGRYFFKLIEAAVKRKSFVAFDCALYSIQPVIIIILGISSTIAIFKYALGVMALLNKTNIINYIYSMNLETAKIFLLFFGIFQLLYTPIILILEKKISSKILLYYLIYPFYVITWFPISAQGLIDKNKKEWSHTIHTRSVKINDLEKPN
jgi:cellulose synthase/poly-beta-1,6-N-acetylglucosamine synthase-like glycosyltransferase